MKERLITIKKSGVYKRVEKRIADEFVLNDGWSYAPKKQWKKYINRVGVQQCF